MSITDWAMFICVAGFVVGLVVLGLFGPETMRFIRRHIRTRKKYARQIQ